MLPLNLFGPVAQWAKIAADPTATVAYRAPFDKRRKQTHRYRIADVRGPLDLTVPIGHPSRMQTPSETQTHHGASLQPQGVPTWDDVPLSDHGQWWHTHLVTLESAYGRTPYFEFYIDSLLPFLSADTPERFPSVAAMCRAADMTVASLLNIPAPREATDSEISQFRTDAPVCVPTAVDAPTSPYWQVRAHTLGFIPGLSILDLLFNLGPEALLFLIKFNGTSRKNGAYVSVMSLP